MVMNERANDIERDDLIGSAHRRATPWW